MNIICFAIGLGALSVEPAWTPKEPEILLPEIERYLRDEHVRYVQEPPIDDSEEYFRVLREELSTLFGDEAATLNVLLIHAEIGETHPDDRSFQLFLGAILFKPLIKDPRKAIEAVAPYWPPENPVLMENIERRFFRPIATTEGQPERFNIDFSELTAVLRDAWAANDHRYDGLVDYMFERNAIMAWLALLEMEGWEPESLDEHYDTTIVFARPYRNQRARTDPSRVEPQVLEDCRALLHEFVQDDSLWARVFAAEILNKVPYLRDPEIEASLRDDPHWLIQRRMAYLDEETVAAE